MKPFSVLLVLLFSICLSHAQIWEYESADLSVFPLELHPSPDGGVYIGGAFNSSNQDPQYSIVKLDANGQEEWVRSYDYNDAFYSEMAVNSAGEIFIVGNDDGNGRIFKLNLIC
ncbi:MAG: hypothetical protein AAFV80_22650, partial [Bacteroidota bacterium]